MIDAMRNITEILHGITEDIQAVCDDICNPGNGIQNMTDDI